MMKGHLGHRLKDGVRIPLQLESHTAEGYLAILPGPVDKDINTEHTYGGRIALEAEPINEFSATLSATYQNMDLGAPFTF